MAALMPQKIVLKSSTRMSLNERFSSINQSSVSQAEVRVRMAAANQLVAKSKREAIQMANRSLTQISANSDNQVSEKSNVRERLGHISARARLGPVRGRGWRGSRPFITRGRFSSFRGRGGANYGGYPANSQYTPSRGTFRGRLSRGYRGRGGNQYGAGGRGSGWGRGGRGRGQFRGRGRGRGRVNWGGVTPMSRQQLDSQLEEYMAKTPGRLDADLDVYMADQH